MGGLIARTASVQVVNARITLKKATREKVEACVRFLIYNSGIYKPNFIAPFTRSQSQETQVRLPAVQTRLV